MHLHGMVQDSPLTDSNIRHISWRHVKAGKRPERGRKDPERVPSGYIQGSAAWWDQPAVANRDLSNKRHASPNQLKASLCPNMSECLGKKDPLGKTAFHHLQNRTTNRYAAWADWFYSHQSPASASTEGSNDKPKWFQNYVIGLQEFIGISLVPARNCSCAWCPEKCFLWQFFTMLLTIVCSVAGVSLGQGCSYATLIYCIRSIRLYVIDLIRFRDLQRYDSAHWIYRSLESWCHWELCGANSEHAGCTSPQLHKLPTSSSQLPF